MTPDGESGSGSDLRRSIQSAYRELRREGYYCRSNFWCCMTCGLAAIPEDRQEKYVFYHRQDDRRIDRDGYCLLAWAGDGDRISEAMRRAYLDVHWNGSPDVRIRVQIPGRTTSLESTEPDAQ